MSSTSTSADGRAAAIERKTTCGEVTFQRMPNGDVAIITPTGSYTINDGHWGSAVLTMSHYDERPNDWQAFMDHHHGRADMLGAAKTLGTIKNVIAHG